MSQSGVILWGSEVSAVKAGMGIVRPHELRQDIDRESRRHEHIPMRLDLDDLTGEICLIDFEKQAMIPEPAERVTKSFYMGVLMAQGKATSMNMPEKSFRRRTTTMRRLADGCITCGEVLSARIVMFQEVFNVSNCNLTQRMIPIQGNPLVCPLPKFERDGVLQDLREIPKVLHHMDEEWATGSSLNNITAWCLGRALAKRVTQRSKQVAPACAQVYRQPQEVIDILITGCEVSLWVAEQFAADLELGTKSGKRNGGTLMTRLSSLFHRVVEHFLRSK